MWSAEDKSLAEGHKREGWTSVSLSIGPKESNKRKAEKDKQDAPKKTLKKDVFGSVEDDSVDQVNAEARFLTLHSHVPSVLLLLQPATSGPKDISRVASNLIALVPTMATSAFVCTGLQQK